MNLLQNSPPRPKKNPPMPTSWNIGTRADVLIHPHIISQPKQYLDICTIIFHLQLNSSIYYRKLSAIAADGILTAAGESGGGGAIVASRWGIVELEVGCGEGDEAGDEEGEVEGKGRHAAGFEWARCSWEVWVGVDRVGHVEAQWYNTESVRASHKADVSNRWQKRRAGKKWLQLENENT